MDNGIAALLEISENPEDLAEKSTNPTPASYLGKSKSTKDTKNRVMQYAVLGKLTAKPKIDGKRVKVQKKAHIIRDGRAICNAENAYLKPPRYTPVENPVAGQICRICLGLNEKSTSHLLDGEQYAEPLLSVLMGERVDDGVVPHEGQGVAT